MECVTRVQAGRIILRFHRVEKMLEQGELQLSHVNIIAPKITDAKVFRVYLNKISYLHKFDQDPNDCSKNLQFTPELSNL